MKIKTAVLFGGRSVEHEVSVISGLQAMESINCEKYEIIPVYIAKNGELYWGEELRDINVYKNIPELKKNAHPVFFTLENGRVYLKRADEKKVKRQIVSEIDVALPVVHGTNVEDGALQGYLKTLGLPFAGCDVLASAVCMDKYVMKVMLRDAGIPVLDACRFFSEDWRDSRSVISAIEDRLSYPVIVKPVNLGSSVGITVASDISSLKAALDTAFTFADTVIAERAVTDLKEVNCAVLGDRQAAEASECEEPFATDTILSYEDKYIGGGKSGSKGMAGLKRIIPADITPEKREQIRSLAVKAFRHLGCAGVARIDFLMDKTTGEVWLNELNTIPGSLSFYLWEPLGVKYTELLDRLISLALKRKREESEITYAFETNILSATSFGSKGSKGSKM